MKKILIPIIATIMVIPQFSFVNREDKIEEIEEKEKINEVKVLNEKFKLETFNSKKEFENFIYDKIYDKIEKHCTDNFLNNYTNLNGIGIVGKPIWSNDSITENVANSALDSNDGNTNFEGKNGYGNTNIQKKGVDEPEILKLGSEYLAYYNSDKDKIYIINAPKKDGKLNFEITNIADEINIPKSINKNNIQLFYVGNQLVVVGERYSDTLNSSITDLVFYNIKNGKAKFDRLYDVKGRYTDARITNGKIYLITSYNIYSTINKICKSYTTKEFEEKMKDIQKEYKDNLISQNKKYYDKAFENARIKTNEIIKEQINNFPKDKIEKYISKEFRKKVIDIQYNKKSKLKIKNKNYPLDIKSIYPNINNIIFLPTQFDDFNIYDLEFSIINIIDLDKKTPSNQYIIFGNIGNGQIHMTQNALYLVNTYYSDSSRKCPAGAMCLVPYYNRGEFSLIHKLNLEKSELKYVNSAITSGMPINQYSMDEDNLGNFRIFTKRFERERKTSLYTFNKDLKLEGSINSIAPSEDFKSSRFIGDKAYLVTFKATDPLFAIDLKDNKNPKIVGELKIPGYSLYLHPFKKINNVQYLVGIGQEAEEINENWSAPKNVKIDLYKIDFDKKDEKGMISVTQEFSKVLGKEEKAKNGGSSSPIFTNPRSFVMFENIDQSQTLLLPVYLAKDMKNENCYIDYIRINGEKMKNGEDCKNYTTKEPYFIGLKGLKIDEKKGISEIISKNYLDKFNVKEFNMWDYIRNNNRTSYYKINNDIIPFLVNNNFIEFFSEKENNDNPKLYTYINEEYNFSINLPKIFEITRVQKEVIDNYIYYTFDFETEDRWTGKYAPVFSIGVMSENKWNDPQNQEWFADMKIANFNGNIIYYRGLQDATSDIKQFYTAMGMNSVPGNILEYLRKNLKLLKKKIQNKIRN